MAVCDVQALASEASCFNCVPPGMQSLLNTSLLCRIARAVDPTMTCDVQTLINQAACFDCISPGMLALVQTQLLCNIANAVGGGGGSSVSFVTCGNGAPTSTPASGCGLYIDALTDAVYIYRNGAWALKV